MEELENDEIAVLDLKQKINSKKIDIQFSVNNKNAHTNVNVDAPPNYPEVMKKVITRGQKLE